MDVKEKKYYYYANDAQTSYDERKSNSRKGIDMTSSEFKYLNDIVPMKLKMGTHFQ